MENPSKISVHDNVLISYEVLCHKREIRFQTEFRGIQPIERTEVIFHGVEAYHFSNDDFSTLIFDIVEEPAESILIQEKKFFEEGIIYCWPGS